MLGWVAAGFVLFSVGLLGNIPPEVDFRDKTSSSLLTMVRSGSGANQPRAFFGFLICSSSVLRAGDSAGSFTESVNHCQVLRRRQ